MGAEETWLPIFIFGKERSDFMVIANDLYVLILMSEANKIGLIDEEWYKMYLKSTLKSMCFDHFKKEPEPVYNKEAEINKFHYYIALAVNTLNGTPGRKRLYSVSRAFNVFVKWADTHEYQPKYTDLLLNMSEDTMFRIRNAGPHTHTVLMMARDYIIADQPPKTPPSSVPDYFQSWANDLAEKYKGDLQNDTSTEETKED